MIDPDFPELDEFQRIDFPDPEKAGPEGIIAAGGNLSPGMLLSAYSQGAFPWYGADEPVLWWNPDPRCVLFPGKLHVSKRMERKLRSGYFIMRSDTCFRDVITRCAGIKRRHESGTWIDDDIIEAYCRLHELGWAHSIETFIRSGDDFMLAGGLYGLSLGHCFFGESMFSEVSDASKAAFISMARALGSLGIEMIDCQLPTSHLMSLGAEELSRSRYMELLDEMLEFPALRGRWNLFS